MGDQPNIPAIEVERVSFAYAPDAPVLESVSIRVEPGERLGILGPNGGGKSTLLKLILGLLTPSAGSIRVLGQPPARARTRRLIGFVPQKNEAELNWPMSVRQVAMMPATLGLRAFGRPARDTRAHIDRVLELVGISELASAPIGELSGGQVQRVMIARAVAATPQVLLLDEPTVGVDIAGQARFAQLIERLRDELALTVVTVSHDLATVAATSDRVACLRRTLHYHASPGGLTPAVLAEVFSHDLTGVFGEIHIDAHRAADCPDPTHHRAHTCDHNHETGGDA